MARKSNVASDQKFLSKHNYPRVGTREVTQFQTQFRGPRPKSVDDQSELLLNCIASLCASKPEYLQVEDATRLIAFVEEFKRFKPQGSRSVGHLPIKQMASVVKEWIHSYFDVNHNLLMPYYALHTIYFIDLVTTGQGSPGGWSLDDWQHDQFLITPILGEEFRYLRLLDNAGSLAGRRIMPGSTDVLFTPKVRAVIPSNVSLRSHHGDVIGPNGTFDFEIHHPAFEETYSATYFYPEYAAGTFPVHKQILRLKGKIAAGPFWGGTLSLPAHWITHQFRETWKDDTGSREELVPAPRWVTDDPKP